MLGLGTRACVQQAQTLPSVCAAPGYVGLCACCVFLRSAPTCAPGQELVSSTSRVQCRRPRCSSILHREGIANLGAQLWLRRGLWEGALAVFLMSGPCTYRCKTVCAPAGVTRWQWRPSAPCLVAG